jgi:CDP-glycerol glycerophosphotransferase (TagB/SpsB family)
MHRLIEAMRRCVRLVYRLLPKRDHAVIWGWPDYEDSVLALEQELQHTSVRRVVLLMTDRRAEPPEPLGAKTRRVTKDSPAGWFAFLFARHVFFTHRCFMRTFPPNVVSVNVWHGMPIKRIGWLCEGDEGIESRFALATAPFWAEIMQRSMTPWDRVLETGLPRNDRLFLDPALAGRALGIDERDDVERLLVWLPTYRRSVRGHITVDGRPTDTPFELDIDPDELNAFLAEQRTLAVVKPHPMAAFAGEQTWSHLLVVDDAWLRARRLSLYRLLGAADVLVSDISSVTIDYLVLDRPIVHALADLDDYGRSRGFSVDRVQDLLMGPVATTFEELRAVLAEVLSGGDPDRDRRRRVRALSHTDPGAGATARLVQELGLCPENTGTSGLVPSPTPPE